MDFLIKNGTLYEPEVHQLVSKDIAFVDGKIAVPRAEHFYHQVIDAKGCIVTPGLIDFHVHYWGVECGVSPDASSFCNGITTAVDAGSTGCSTFPVFYRTDIVNSRVRILSDLLVASGGQTTWKYNENIDPELYDENEIAKLFERYSGLLVGLKARLSKYVIRESDAEDAVLRMVMLAEKVKTRLILHVTDCAMPLDKLSSMLRRGDVICHIYQNLGSRDRTCLDANGRVLEGLWAARERGIIFDASHGKGNYDLEVCRSAVEQGFVPDIISSDNNANGSFIQPLHSLPRILSKYLDFGMKLEDILDCATITPARLIGHPQLGTLKEGTPADAAIFRLKEKKIRHMDINGNVMEGRHVLVPQMTFKDGRCMYCQTDFT